MIESDQSNTHFPKGGNGDESFVGREKQQKQNKKREGKKEIKFLLEGADSCGTAVLLVLVIPGHII
jgi:hypothetical protein